MPDLIPTPLASVWGSLPSEIRVLYVSSGRRAGGWLEEALAADSAARVEFSECHGVTPALARLREEAFDAVLVGHESGVLDALELIEGMRAGGSDEPAIVLSSIHDPALATLCYEVGADGYVAENATTTRGLIWTFSRAIERQQLVRENRRLREADRQRLEAEHHEAERLLAQQRRLIDELECLGRWSNSEAPVDPNDDAVAKPSFSQPPLPRKLSEHYREMLRAYVMMGCGNLGREMERLADMLATARVGARQTMQLHLEVLEELVRGLGNRSARHVMNRADLLILEVMIHLAENYRRRVDSDEVFN